MADSYDFYSKRIEELKSLLNNSNSNTSKELISEAIELSEKAVSEYLFISTESVKQIKSLDEKQAKFDEQLKIMESQSEKMKSVSTMEFFSDATREKLTVAWLAVSEEINEKYERHTFANRSLRDAILFCCQELDTTLFDLIFKPNSSSFKADLILDVLKKIVQKLIPFSDDIESIFELSVSKRKKTYLSHGNKILTYIEKYISVLQSWLSLTDKFKEEVLT